ncbi:hypothetical protein BLNAU_14028 [Blattamonas nauphoetae]|uniref:non-specific serine/threonine protein kinase n=1 Tax=Blattamonas nauphoetae TaxID=2049346 RepID=A0ABQ9XF15_9EUKA|nr:hypothetical protein BLNAU_14028 [Blattamonas nauphoetae]
MSERRAALLSMGYKPISLDFESVTSFEVARIDTGQLASALILNKKEFASIGFENLNKIIDAENLSPFILHYIDYVPLQRDFIIIREHITLPPLGMIIEKSDSPFDKLNSIAIFVQLLLALQSTYVSGFLHRSVDLDCVYFKLDRKTDRYQLRLDGIIHNTHITDPEALVLCEKEDVWNAAIVFYECLFCRHPFHNLSLHELRSLSSPPPLIIPSSVSTDLSNFLSSVLTLRHSQRPSISEVLSSPFLAPFIPTDTVRTGIPRAVFADMLQSSLPSTSPPNLFRHQPNPAPVPVVAPPTQPQPKKQDKGRIQYSSPTHGWESNSDDSDSSSQSDNHRSRSARRIRISGLDVSDVSFDSTAVAVHPISTGASQYRRTDTRNTTEGVVVFRGDDIGRDQIIHHQVVPAPLTTPPNSSPAHNSTIWDSGMSEIFDGPDQSPTYLSYSAQRRATEQREKRRTQREDYEKHVERGGKFEKDDDLASEFIRAKFQPIDLDEAILAGEEDIIERERDAQDEKRRLKEKQQYKQEPYKREPYQHPKDEKKERRKEPVHESDTSSSLSSLPAVWEKEHRILNEEATLTNNTTFHTLTLTSSFRTISLPRSSFPTLITPPTSHPVTILDISLVSSQGSAVIGATVPTLEMEQPYIIGSDTFSAGYDLFFGTCRHVGVTHQGNSLVTVGDLITAELDRTARTLRFWVNNEIQPVGFTNVPDDVVLLLFGEMGKSQFKIISVAGKRFGRARKDNSKRLVEWE